MTCFHLAAVDVIPAIVSVEPNKKALHPSAVQWTLRFNTEVRKTGGGHLRLYRVSSPGWNIDGRTGHDGGRIYPSSISVSSDGRSAAVALPARHGLADGKDERYFVQFSGDVFVASNVNDSAAGLCPGVDRVRLPARDFWMFKLRDANPPRLTFTWSNEWKMARPWGSSPAFSISWTSSERPHSDSCELVRVAGGGESWAVPCANATWTPSSSDLSKGGLHLLRVSTADAENNTAVWDAEFTVDLKPPVAAVVHGPSAPVANTAGDNAYFDLACADADGGRCRLVIKLNNVPIGATTTPFLSSAKHTYRYGVAAMGLKEGLTYTLEVIPTDLAGNVGSTLTHTWTIDKASPALSVRQNATVACESDLPALPPPSITNRRASKEYTVAFTDLVESCRVVRTWRVTDSAGNTAAIAQSIAIDRRSDARLLFLPSVRLRCDSSSQAANESYPTSATVHSTCFKQVVFNVSSVDSASPSCPGVWNRTFVAADTCTNRTIRGTQVVETADVCPPEACGRGLRRGVCMAGRCKCNRNWYGDNCQTLILPPLIAAASKSLNVSLDEGQDFAFMPSQTQGTPPLTWTVESSINCTYVEFHIHFPS